MLQLLRFSTLRRRLALAAILAFCGWGFLPSPVHATTIWQSNSNADFLTPGNWSAGVPSTSDINSVVATFNGTGSQNNLTFGANIGGTSGSNGINGMLITGGQTAPLSINASTTGLQMRFRRDTGITINSGAGAFSLGTSGSTFSLQPSSNNISVPPGVFTLTNNSSNTATLGALVLLGRGGNGIVNYTFGGSGNWDVLGATSASAGVAIVKNGAGTLTLSGANLHLGGTTLNAGVLRATHTSALGDGLVSNNGGVLQLLNNGAGNNGTINYSSANLAFITNSGSTAAIHVGNLTANTGNTIALGAYTLGNSTINVTGADNYALSINALSIGGVSAGTAVLNPTTANLTLGTVNNTTAFAHTLELSGSATGNLITGAVTNSSNILSLAKTGAGTWTLAGTNTYSGTTTVSAGTLQIGNGGTTGTLGAGAVTNNAVLAFNRSDNFTVSHAISGSGALVKLGAGTASLTGGNSYAGTTTISAGTLQVGSGGTTGTLGAGNVVNNATLAFNRSNDFTVANDISGSGALVKLGAGTASLTGGNNYAGTTTISAGTLQVGNGGTTGSLGAGDVANNATLTLNRSNNFTVANDISGSGALVKLGAGTAALTGTNSYAGTTTITAGTLQVGVGGATGGLGAGNILNNATLALNRNNTFTVANTISGSGALTQIGAGTATLTAANSYTGTTTVSAGTLVVANSHTNAGAYTVSGGVLAGGGTITTASNADVTVNGSGKLSPGAGLGTMTLNLGGGSLNLAGIGLEALLFDLGPGGTSDRIQLNTGLLALGTLSLNEFDFNVTGNLNLGDTFLLLDANNHSGGVDVTPGLFANNKYGGYLSLVGNDVWLTIDFTSVPEPSTLALGLGGAAALFFAALRRRKSVPQ